MGHAIASGTDYRSPAKKFFRLLGWTLLVPILAAITGWEILFVYCSNLPEGFRLPAAIGIGLVSAGVLLIGRLKTRSLLIFLAVFAVLLFWFFSIPASNDRDWLPDLARLSWAEIDGDFITVHNIRNCDYRSETDFTVAYYDRRFDLRQLKSVDVVAVYWMGPAIAHILLSFGFEDGAYLAVSIEARKEKGEGYSTVKGFFRQYELYYVVADERDVIRLRTNYRKDPPEDVFVYRLQGPIENGRRLFLAYMEKLNSLKARPEFYNSLTTNCTTNIWTNTHVNPDRIPLSWKILMSGYVPDYLYETGRLDNKLPFFDLKRRAHVNARARAADTAADFSQRIRQRDVSTMPAGQADRRAL